MIVERCDGCGTQQVDCHIFSVYHGGDERGVDGEEYRVAVVRSDDGDFTSMVYFCDTCVRDSVNP